MTQETRVAGKISATMQNGAGRDAQESVRRLTRREARTPTQTARRPQRRIRDTGTGLAWLRPGCSAAMRNPSHRSLHRRWRREPPSLFASASAGSPEPRLRPSIAARVLLGCVHSRGGGAGRTISADWPDTSRPAQRAATEKVHDETDKHPAR